VVLKVAVSFVFLYITDTLIFAVLGTAWKQVAQSREQLLFLRILQQNISKRKRTRFALQRLLIIIEITQQDLEPANF
jgi:hypothetical protein